jgi:uroporphyrinogen-III synthase
VSEEPLAGFTVGVTAARRHEELSALLERRGARVVYAPAIRLVTLSDDALLLTATRQMLADPVDDVIVTTGIGFRAWLETADGWGLRDGLIRQLHAARILARGPKARGAVRAAGMAEAWSQESESCEEVLRHLLTEDLTGRRIAVQLYGEPCPELTDGLRAAGATVLEIPVYQWAPAEDPEPLRRLVEQAVGGTLDAITFTSAPAVAATLAVAEKHGTGEALLQALRTRVVAACVGPVTAAPLERRCVPTVRPDRARLGALVRALAADLPVRGAGRLTVHGHTLELRGHAVLVDGRLRPVTRAPMEILRALAARPGHVVSRADLCGVLPSGSASGGPWAARLQPDEHAVEMAVARLRRVLGPPGLIETVVKRGYRLACEPAAEGR